MFMDDASTRVRPTGLRWFVIVYAAMLLVAIVYRVYA